MTMHCKDEIIIGTKRQVIPSKTLLVIHLTRGDLEAAWCAAYTNKLASFFILSFFFFWPDIVFEHQIE